jgi:hypothetical protein
VNGVKALELTSTPRAQPSKYVMTLYINPATYLPESLDYAGQQDTFRWLPATKANISALSAVQVPRGFRRVKDAGGPGF